MKIGFLGNANNYPFMLALALKAKGHDVLFVIDSENPLNRPENRYPNIPRPYPEWILDCSSSSDAWSFYTGEEARKAVDALRSCDSLILNEFAPSIWKSIRKPCFALLTGTDLEVLADLQYVEFVYPPLSNFRLRDLLSRSHWIGLVTRHRARQRMLTLINNQRGGISNAVGVNYFPVGSLPNGDRLLTEMGVSHRNRVFFMMGDIDRYSCAPYPSNSKLRIFNVARITWKKPREHFICELDYKGTDVLIRGLGLFIRNHPSAPALDIRLVRKGADIEATEQLIREEGIENSVTWLEAMNQTELYEEYKSADIVTEHFGEGSIGMGALDAMATGRPVITRCSPEVFKREFGEESPICHAATAQEICDQLTRLSASREIREKIGRDSRRYVEQYFSPERAADLVLEKLQHAA